MVATGIGFCVPVPPPARVLRIAVVVDLSAVPAWVQELLTNLEGASWVDWYLVDAEGGSRLPRRGGFAYRLLEARDRRVIRHPSLDDAQRLVDARSVLSGSVQRPDRFDVVVDLGAGPPRERPDLEPYGCVWSIEFVTPRDSPPKPDLFWAWFDQRAVAEINIVETEPAAGERTLVASSVVSMHSRSLTVSRSRAYWRAGDLILRGLACRAATGASPTPNERTPAPPPNLQPSSFPGPGTVLRVAARGLRRAARRGWDYPRLREQWILGLRRSNARRCLDEHGGFEVIIPPQSRDYADPFVVSDGPRQYVFIEEFTFASDKGHISVIELGDDGSVSDPRPVLVRPYHLSYPFVFKDGTDWYLIPETGSRRTIELYLAASFPDAWEYVTDLATGIRALDTTIHVDSSGRYWLFTSLEQPGRNRNDELFLFSSTEITGPWSPHPENPIVSDVRFARPAGRLFVKDHVLIRPAQDCSSRYGAATVFRQVVKLDEAHYEEETVATLTPAWNPGLVGAHTYNVDGNLEVVDGSWMISRRGTYRAFLSHLVGRAVEAMAKNRTQSS